MCQSWVSDQTQVKQVNTSQWVGHCILHNLIYLPTLSAGAWIIFTVTFFILPCQTLPSGSPLFRFPIDTTQSQHVTAQAPVHVIITMLLNLCSVSLTCHTVPTSARGCHPSGPTPTILCPHQHLYIITYLDVPTWLYCSLNCLTFKVRQCVLSTNCEP